MYTRIKNIKNVTSVGIADQQEEDFGRLVTFWFSTFAMLISRYNTLPFIFECFMMKKTPSGAYKQL